MAIGSFEITPLEMVRAYTAFANGGLLSDLTAMLEVYDNDANPIFVAQPKSKQVLTPQIAFLVTSLLQSVIDHGTGLRRPRTRIHSSGRRQDGNFS